MKNKISTLLILVLLVSACQKEERHENAGWNCISFTTGSSPEYPLHMNDPHISFTFPSKIKAGDINYIEGQWVYGTMIYVLTTHNWGMEEILFSIHKNGETVHQQTLLPGQNSGLSLTFGVTPGTYTFSAAVNDSGKLTHLTPYPLHNSKEFMSVE